MGRPKKNAKAKTVTNTATSAKKNTTCPPNKSPLQSPTPIKKVTTRRKPKTTVTKPKEFSKEEKNEIKKLTAELKAAKAEMEKLQKANELVLKTNAKKVADKEYILANPKVVTFDLMKEKMLITEGNIINLRRKMYWHNERLQNHCKLLKKFTGNYEKVLADGNSRDAWKNCELCQLPFNADDRSARLLRCGHTLCLQCTTKQCKLFKRFECSLDGSAVPIHPQAAKVGMGMNYSVQHMCGI